VNNLVQMQAFSDPICSSAGCGYNSEKSYKGHPLNYFVPNFGMDEDIKTSMANEAASLKAIKWPSLEVPAEMAKAAPAEEKVAAPVEASKNETDTAAEAKKEEKAAPAEEAKKEEAKKAEAVTDAKKEAPAAEDKAQAAAKEGTTPDTKAEKSQATPVTKEAAAAVDKAQATPASEATPKADATPATEKTQAAPTAGAAPKADAVAKAEAAPTATKAEAAPVSDAPDNQTKIQIFMNEGIDPSFFTQESAPVKKNAARNAKGKKSYHEHSRAHFKNNYKNMEAKRKARNLNSE